jgi:hypothetical protein
VFQFAQGRRCNPCGTASELHVNSHLSPHAILNNGETEAAPLRLPDIKLQTKLAMYLRNKYPVIQMMQTVERRIALVQLFMPKA